MRTVDLDDFQRLMGDVFECYGNRIPSATALGHWVDALHEHPLSTVERVLKTWLRTKQKAPVIADIVQICAGLLSDSIEARAAADKRAFGEKFVWQGKTPFAEKCIADMRALLSKPGQPPNKQWARKIMENPNSNEFQRDFARPRLRAIATR